MKRKMLLLLLALIVAPAWAGDATVALSTTESSAQAIQAIQAEPNTKTCSEKLALLGEEAFPKGSVSTAAGSVTPMTCPTGCKQMVCSGVSGCFKRGCVAC